MEFKARLANSVIKFYLVDVETEWNLKSLRTCSSVGRAIVDVETEWNLKAFKLFCCRQFTTVDVETEWNLKIYNRDENGEII